MHILQNSIHKQTVKLLLAITPLLSFPAFAQQEQVAKAAAAQVQRQLSDEQVQLVHGQPWYMAGERLWFSAAVRKNSATPASRVLYVELLDAKGNTLVNQRLVLEEGKAQGDFLLPSEMSSGRYTLRAATNWMRNFSAGQHWQEQLTIVNAGEVKALEGRPGAAKPLQVRFYPESGAWAADVPTKIVANVTNAAGIGIAAQGTVTDTSGQVITTFKSDATGIAVFNLAATAQQELIAQLQATGYAPQQVVLPKPKQQGVSLAVSGVSEEGIQVKVRGLSQIGHVLVAAAAGKVYFAQHVAGSETVTIPWSDAAHPACRLLLLNTGGLVEAEQRVMISRATGIAVQTDQKQYGTRQQVTVTVKGLPPTSLLTASVAAQRAVLQQPDGSVQANWVRQEHNADNELWQAIAKSETVARFTRETLVEPMRQEGIKGPYQQVAFSKQMDSAFVKALPPHVVNIALKHYTRTNIHDIYGLTEPHATSPLPRLPADRVFKLDEYIAFQDVEEAIREVTTNLRMRKKKGRQTVRLLYVAPGTKRMMKEEPLYLLDGVMLENMDEIMALDLNDIASIELAWSEEKLYAGNLGRLVDNGMFAVYTKSGEARDRLRDKGLPVLYEQFSLPRNFVVPAPGNMQAQLPDFRQLLHWQPYLPTEADGSASFTFYTSDETGVFEIKIQGQTAAGIPISGNSLFEVKLLN
ncbi:hypothetical protein [Pontibacter ramchanderi]|uniref:MG2 domain-containing protein n=1 Tax=Pontibacter ramchanderi TaxID=1179743 RepID=A0A2N3UCE2_9BACT|nr:hypothetical protein [Pontibacter ramchanderi]PKV67037.1 hypothetical protein BD749_2176 [Pontibacter ramchanderi]